MPFCLLSSRFFFVNTTWIGFKSLTQYRQRTFQVFFFQDVGNTHLVISCARRCVKACRWSHHHRFTFVTKLFQTPAAELLAVVYGQLGHGVKGAHGYGRIYAWYAIEPVDKAFTTLYILFVHTTIIVVGCIERCFGHDLSQQWRRQTCLTKLHHSSLHLGIFRDERAHAPHIRNNV